MYIDSIPPQKHSYALSVFSALSLKYHIRLLVVKPFCSRSLTGKEIEQGVSVIEFLVEFFKKISEHGE